MDCTSRVPHKSHLHVPVIVASRAHVTIKIVMTTTVKNVKLKRGKSDKSLKFLVANDVSQPEPDLLILSRKEDEIDKYFN